MRSGCQKNLVRWPIPVRAVGPARTGQGIAATLGAFLACAQVLAICHVGLVAHRTCALHGESVHAARPGAPVALAKAFPGPLGARAAVRSAAGDGDSHDHDHCLCMGQGRERFLGAPVAHDGRLFPVLAAEPELARVARPLAIVGLWSLAPKTSPPA
jgi:hypothetical protein